jgi:hypothetical protein
MRKILPLVVSISFLVLSCTSTSPNDAFLIKNLDDQSKAQVLTSEGIQEYDLHLNHRQEFDQIPRIKQFFSTALSYDPNNTQAQQYLALIDNFKSQKLQANLNSATKVLAKAKRTDDDNYVLFVSLQTASRLDPADPQVKKMLGDTSQDRSKLVDAYLAKSKASMSGITDKTPDATREKQYTDAYQSAGKALDIDPKSSVAQGQLNSVKAELTKIVAVRAAAIQKLIATSKFADARTQVTALNDLNRKTSNGFDADVRNVSYSLNFSWAKSLYGQKDYSTADVRVDAALAVKRTDEATSLKKQIAAVRTKVDASVSFDASLQDIDRLITSDELVSAHRKIDVLARATTDQAKLASLDDRRQTITGKLKDIYDKAVQAYRDEDFKTAIELLQTVVGVQVDYEQAGDYLDKARSKQKVLDQLQ